MILFQLSCYQSVISDEPKVRGAIRHYNPTEAQTVAQTIDHHCVVFDFAGRDNRNCRLVLAAI